MPNTKVKTAMSAENEQMQVYMSMDPETFRVTVSPREFDDLSFPRGLRGVGWEQRTGTISKKWFYDMLEGKIDNDEQDTVIRELWSKNGKTPWPGYAIIREEVQHGSNTI